MDTKRLMDEYLECLSRYFYLLGETAELSMPIHIKKVQLKTLEDLTKVAGSLRYLLAPVLKEK